MFKVRFEPATERDISRKLPLFLFKNGETIIQTYAVITSRLPELLSI